MPLEPLNVVLSDGQKIEVLKRFQQRYIEELKKLLLSRSLGELYETCRDFIVAEAEVGGLVGCAALHIDTDKIGELKALAVAQSAHGQGIGRQLVERCCAEAVRLGLEKVFCLT